MLGGLDRLHRVAKRIAGSEVERDRGGGKLRDVVDDKRGVALADAGHRRQPHLRAGVGGDGEVVERGEAALEGGRRFEDDTILVGLREDGRDEALAEGICLIEWPERLGEFLPAERLDLALAMGKTDNARVARLSGSSAWQKRLEGLGR